jgi:uridine kinase
MSDPIPDLAEACTRVVAEIRRLQATRQAPILVALDGGSGAGKSTLASLIEQNVDVALVQLDDFFSADVPDAEWDARSAAERARDVFDWRRLRVEALDPLLAGKPARWHAFDFQAGPRADGTYGMRTDCVECEPASVILLEGAYSAGPALADLVDLAVLVDVPVGERHARLAAREEIDFLERWHGRWDAVEEHYFTHVRPCASFDLVVTPGQSGTNRVNATGSLRG